MCWDELYSEKQRCRFRIEVKRAMRIFFCKLPPEILSDIYRLTQRNRYSLFHLTQFCITSLNRNHVDKGGSNFSIYTSVICNIGKFSWSCCYCIDSILLGFNSCFDSSNTLNENIHFCYVSINFQIPTSTFNFQNWPKLESFQYVDSWLYSHLLYSWWHFFSKKDLKCAAIFFLKWCWDSVQQLCTYNISHFLNILDYFVAEILSDIYRMVHRIC